MSIDDVPDEWDPLDPTVELNKAQLALYFGVSLPTIAAWERAGMPVEERGRPGKAARINLSKAFNWWDENRAPPGL